MPTTTKRRSPSGSSSPKRSEAIESATGSMVMGHPIPRGWPNDRHAIEFIDALPVGMALAWSVPLVPQTQTPGAAPPAAPPGLTASFRAERSSDAFTLTYFNRPIVVFRASVLGRGPFERGVGARRILDDSVERSAV